MPRKGVKGGDIVYPMVGDPEPLKKDIDDAEKMVVGQLSGISGKVKLAIGAAGAATAVAIGAAFGKAVGLAEEVNASQARIQTQLGKTREEAEAFGDVIRDVYRNNFGDSLAEVGDTVGEVALQLKRTGQDGAEDVQQVTEAAYGLRDAFGIGVGESAGAAATLMVEFGLSGQEAMDFITKGMQEGLNASGDFLDSIGEYSNQFAEGGATAAQFFSLMETGMAGGVLGTDKAADAFKEFQVRILDGSKTTAEALGQLGINHEEFTGRISSGQMTVADAFNHVIGKLWESQDAAVQMQAGVGLLGTQFEDLGARSVFAIDLTNTSMEDLIGTSQSLSEQYKTLSNDAEGLRRKWDLAQEALGQALIPVLNDFMNTMAPIIESTATWIEQHPVLTRNILAGVAGVGSLVAALAGVSAALPGATALLGAAKVAFAAIGTAATAVGLSVSATVGVVVGAVGLIAAGIIFAGNGIINEWENIKKLWNEIWSGIVGAVQWAWGLIEPIFSAIGSGLNWVAGAVGLGGGGGVSPVAVNAVSSAGVGGGGGTFGRGGGFGQGTVNQTTNNAGGITINVEGAGRNARDVAEEVYRLLGERLGDDLAGVGAV